MQESPSTATRPAPSSTRHIPSKLEAEGSYAANAGLVLIAPFLPILFERAEIYRDKRWLSAESAMLLLHFVATGRETAREHELVIAKVLCDWDLEEPIELADRLPEPAQVQAMSLLGSVLEHWSLLKNTSVDGLREAFLQRPGKVTRNERNEWTLLVEQRSYDMLLDQLPWSFAFIKLPWMRAPLRTEWR
jgi:hypothetical protein